MSSLILPFSVLFSHPNKQFPQLHFHSQCNKCSYVIVKVHFPMSWYQRLYLVDRGTCRHLLTSYQIIASLSGGIRQKIKIIKSQKIQTNSGKLTKSFFHPAKSFFLQFLIETSKSSKKWCIMSPCHEVMTSYYCITSWCQCHHLQVTNLHS